MIRFEAVRFAYRDDAPVLDAADLEIPDGLTLLLGPNGCGKSTLLKLAAGVERPGSGRVRIDGLDLWTDEVAARSRLAYVPEQPDLTPYATVREILRLVCGLRATSLEEADRALERLGLAGLGRRSVRELSLGQRRRAVLAAAMIGSLRVLLLDEPLEAMDRGAREQILAWVTGAVSAGGSALVATHEIEPFVAACSRVVTVRHGRAEVHDALPAEPASRLRSLEAWARGDHS